MSFDFSITVSTKAIIGVHTLYQQTKQLENFFYLWEQPDLKLNWPMIPLQWTSRLPENESTTESTHYD